MFRTDISITVTKCQKKPKCEDRLCIVNNVMLGFFPIPLLQAN